jgi:hypothetical protein
MYRCQSSLSTAFPSGRRRAGGAAGGGFVGQATRGEGKGGGGRGGRGGLAQAQGQGERGGGGKGSVRGHQDYGDTTRWYFTEDRIAQGVPLLEQ